MAYNSDNHPIRIALTGDSLITRKQSVFNEPEFLQLVKILRDADFSVTNAEMLFHDYEHSPTFVPGGTYMRADPNVIDELRWFGIDAVATANNHAYDYGEQGVLTNLHNLKARGLAAAGTGATLGEARAPTYLETSSGRAALISVTTSGPLGLYAQHQWRDGKGRPGANMIRYTTTYCVPQPIFDSLKAFRHDFGLTGFSVHGSSGGNRDHTERRAAFADHSWGMSAEPDSDTEFYLGALQSQWQYPVPNGCRIRLSDRPSVEHRANNQDVEENLKRIHDARRMADYVIVSIHNHEGGVTMDEPTSMVRDFAHQAIDAGAHVIHGHGPHRDRGIEIYKGRPIFYSIGHLFMENETVDIVPLDNHFRSGVETPWLAMPADFYDTRSGREHLGEWKGPTAEPFIWRDIVAVVEFDKDKLTEIILQPIDLGYGRPRGQRGRPTIATGEIAQAVLSLFQRLSEPLGTKIRIDKDVGRVILSETPS